MWNKIKQIISPLAPILGGMIGGPAGATAGVILKQTLLGDKNASDEQLLAAIERITPEQQSSLKQADYNYQISMAKIASDNQKIDTADRANARQSEKYILVRGIRDLTTPRLAYIVTVGFIIMAIYVLYLVKLGSINTEEGTIIGLLIGHFLSEVKQVLSYYFGSTASASEKDKIIENITK